jgi:(5-formylfuran-3-yl)methyl phosphate synthase
LAGGKIIATSPSENVMTQMLASVTSVTEALLALELGADIIDLKNPQTGALGALPLATQKEIVEAIDGRQTLSATIGDMPSDPIELQTKIAATAATGVDIVKIGIATSSVALASWQGMPWKPVSTRLVAVLFADEPLDLNWLVIFAQINFYGVMLDTADKLNGSLREHCTDDELQRFVHRARECNLVCGLAGSLRLDDIGSLLTIAPDYLGFRGALCAANSRLNELDPQAFYAIRSRIQNKKIKNPESRHLI